MTEPLLSARGVTKRYGGVFALRDVAFAVEPSQICGLIGPNGAGKTTLFDVLSGIQGHDSGSIVLNGSDISGKSPTWRARHGLRRTFQRQQPFHWLSVADNLLVALEWRTAGRGFLPDLVGLRRRHPAHAERVSLVLDLLDLKDLADKPTATLTIGQIRLIELARALVDRPSLILLDEPTSGLSRKDTLAVGRAITRVRDEEGCAVALVEHDVPFVMAHCDVVTVLHLGSVLTVGTPAEVRSDAAVAAAYLGDSVIS